MKVDTGIGGSLAGVAAAAATAEDEGFDGVVTAETAHDPFLPLTLAATTTSRIDLATGIAVAFARSPMTLAQTAWDIQDLSGGRLILGLGSQIRPHITRRFSMPWSHPAARMREFVLALHAIWDAFSGSARLDFRGDFYEHTLLTPFFNPGPIDAGKPRVFLAAVGERMTEVVGEVCDGMLVHGFTTERYLREVTVPALGRGAAAGGRDVSAVELSLPAFVVTGRDEATMAAAAAAVRSQIAFYGSTPAYRGVLELHGWRGVCRMLALMILGVIPLLDGAVVSRPSDVGLRPDGAGHAEAAVGDDASGGSRVASSREILTNPSLWLIAAACGLVFFGSMGIMNHGIAFAHDRGIDPLRASGMLSAIAFGAGIGKLAFGWLAGHMGEHGAFAVSLGMQIACLAGYLVVPSYAGLIAISLVYGLGLGGVSPLQVALLARSVGARSFAPAQGLLGPIQIPFQIAGPILAGAIADRHGSYDLAIGLFIAAMLVSALALGALYVRDVRSAEVADEPAPA